MGALADEFVRIRADTSYLGKDIKKQGATSGKTFGGSFTGALKAVFAGAAIIGAAKTLAGVLQTSLMGASDLSETISKSGKIWGSNAKAIEDWSKKASRNIGLSQQEALEAAASFGDMFLQLGFAKSSADDMAKSVVELSADLGSFNNLPTADVSERISAALRGEYDSLQLLVPTITAATVEKEALRATGKKSAKQLTAEDKAAAVLKITFDNTKRAAGDFKDTQDEVANSLKTVKARAKDASDQFGNLIKPAALKILHWVLDTGLPAVEDFVKQLSQSKELKTSLQELGKAIGLVTGADFGANLDKIATSLPPAISGLADVITKYKEISGVIDKFEQETMKPPANRGWFSATFGPGGTVDRALVFFRESVVTLWRTVTGWIRRLGLDIEKIWDAAAAWIVASVKRFVAQMASWFATLWRTVTGWIRRLGLDIQRLWNGALTWLSTRWTRFWTSVKQTASSAMTAVKTGINTGLAAVRTAFSNAVAAVGRIWDQIRAIARTPVAFVVNTVLEGGLLRAFRAISNLVGYNAGKNFHVSMAQGGILPGYSPGKDIHRFYSATGGILDLSGGEPILRPELGRVIGKKRVDAANSAAAHGRLREAQGYLGGFATGGFFGGTAPVSGRWNPHSGYSWARVAGDIPVGMNTPVHAWKAGIIAAVRHLTSSYGNHIIENVGGSSVYYAHLARAIVSAGQRVNQGQVIGYSDSTGNSTGPHLHFEIRGGSSPIGSAGGGGGSILQALNPAKYLAMVTGALGKLGSIRNTPWGQMVAGIATKAADGVKTKIRDLAASFMVGAGKGAGFTSVSGGSNRAIGHKMMLQRWGESQWPPLNSLWTKESGWNHRARNPSSGAYGIPQSLPASKMRSAGADYLTNPATQIKWGLGYIASRYGSPSSAWRHSQQTNWYGNGGLITEPVIGMGMRTGQRYGFGERGPETVTPGRGGRPINIMIDLGEGLQQRVSGILDEHDEFHASIGRMHR